MSETILLEQDSHFYRLILNRPDKRNAFDEQMLQEMIKSVETVRVDKKARGLIICSSGAHFCAGGDIQWMQRAVSMSERENFEDAKQLALLMYQLYHLNVPTLSLVCGSVFGGGLGLVACSDSAIALNTSTFCLSEVKLGLIPAVIGPYIFKAMGQRQAQHYLLTAQPFCADQALRVGLVHEIATTQDELETLAQQWCRHIQQAGPVALDVAKKFSHEMQDRELCESTIDITAACIASVRCSDEAQEGTKAFLEKRSPHWNSQE